MITIELDMTQFADEIRQTLRVMDSYVLHAAKMSEHFLEVIQARTPKDTGGTRASWTVHMHKASDVILWEISPDGKEDIVTFLEFGTKPHMIEGNPILAFYWKKIDQDVFVHYVMHPGTKPLGFVRITQDDIDKTLAELTQKTLDTIRQIWS